jgi:predicted ThiF/HesA family dinucleotide-utilizing enzyme
MIKSIVEKSHFKILKDDIVTVREVGGLYGSVICVRRSDLNEEIMQYAKRNGIHIVKTRTMYDDLEAILCK